MASKLGRTRRRADGGPQDADGSHGPAAEPPGTVVEGGGRTWGGPGADSGMARGGPGAENRGGMGQERMSMMGVRDTLVTS